MADEKKKKLPIYRALIEDYEDGIQAVSLVEFPAVERNFVAMSKEDAPKVEQRFEVQDEEKRIITGLLMAADTPIYRYDEFRGEFYEVFEKETCRVMAEKMLSDWAMNRVNLQHDDGTYVNGVQMFEVYIKDSANGISPKGFEDVKDGSIFVSYKVYNDFVWNEVKKGTFKGFSLQGWFGIEEMKNNEEMSEVEALLSKINERINQLKKK